MWGTLSTLGSASVLLCAATSQRMNERSAAEDRFLEVVKIEDIRTPSVHLALLDREVSRLTAEVARHKKLVRKADGEVDNAEDHEKRLKRSRAVRARRELTKVEGRLERAIREGVQSDLRSLVVAHCWDGFAKRPIDVWFFEEGRFVARLHPAVILAAELEPASISIVRGTSKRSFEWQLPFDRWPPVEQAMAATVKKGRILAKDPEGFMRQQFAAGVMPWETYPVGDLSEIKASVAESPRASETMLHLRFDPPDGNDLATVTFRLFALDVVGNIHEELTESSGLTERNLIGGFIFTYFDPGRRFAHGFAATVVSATYRGRAPLGP